METIKILCNHCNKLFDKNLYEYRRQKNKGNNYFYCSKQCCISGVVKKQIKHYSILRQCLFCHLEFNSSTHKKYKKCCSSDCAKKYAQSKTDSQKISKSMIAYYKENPPKKTQITCVVCNKNFLLLKNRKKTCSKECKSILISKNSMSNPNCGGETNFKKFKYNNIWMDSSWELNIAKWLDLNKIKWIRDRKIVFYWTDINGKKRRYYPDFFLPEKNIYLDPKNSYKLEQDLYKLEQVIKENKINLIFGDEKKIIDNLKTI